MRMRRCPQCRSDVALLPWQATCLWPLRMISLAEGLSGNSRGHQCRSRLARARRPHQRKQRSVDMFEQLNDAREFQVSGNDRGVGSRQPPTGWRVGLEGRPARVGCRCPCRGRRQLGYAAPSFVMSSLPRYRTLSARGRRGARGLAGRNCLLSKRLSANICRASLSVPRNLCDVTGATGSRVGRLPTWRERREAPLGT
jgi:hypothetical protein